MAAMVVIALIPFFGPDPAPSTVRSRTRADRLECERVTTEQGTRSRPGLVRPTNPRGDFVERSVVICTDLAMRPGLRSARDEAILSDLDVRASELATAAVALWPELDAKTWLVETFYPNAQVATKIAFAAKNALMEQGVQVSDRLVTLAVGDIAVLTRMSPSDAYPAACERYHALGSLRPDDVLLALVYRDPRETQLHGGLCVAGRWTWLR